jgi:hypothetical protein
VDSDGQHHPQLDQQLNLSGSLPGGPGTRLYSPSSMWAPLFAATRQTQTFSKFRTTCYWRRSTWIVQVFRLPQRRSTPTLRPRQLGHHPPCCLAHPTVATAATVATGTRTTTRTAMEVTTTAGTTTAVVAVIAPLARPPPPLPLTAEPACHG